MSEMEDAPPTLDEVHITLEQFEDEITYEADGTAVLYGMRHRCPDGTPCADASKAAQIARQEEANHG